MAALSFARADEVPAAALIDAFNAAFADYLLRFPPLDDEGWRQFVARQGADLALGRVALRAGEVVAFLLVTPRAARRSRIAVMGARPAERGSGVAARLLDDAIGAARQRGERSVELEVFAQNPRALALYRSRGFEAVCALHGFVSEPAPGAAAEPKGLDAVTRDDAVRWLAEAEAADAGRWPWQVGSAAVASALGDVNCWRLGQAQLIFRAAPGEGPVAVVSLIDRGPTQAGAAALLAALRAGYPTRTLQAPQLQRDDGPALAFDAAGWTRLPLHQLLLRLPLDERDLGQSPP
jgi:ribosomal protein S18 acetylase RimI-like enzyme